MPQIEECMYVDYDATEPDYARESWYQDAMFAYQSARECEEF